MALLQGQNDNKGPIPWKEARAFLKIGGECFESVYLGVNMNTDEKSKIICAARELNPDIKIYQMEIDANAFKFNAELLNNASHKQEKASCSFWDMFRIRKHD